MQNNVLSTHMSKLLDMVLYHLIDCPHQLILGHHMRWFCLKLCLVAYTWEAQSAWVDAKQSILRLFTCICPYTQSARSGVTIQLYE